MKKKIVSLVLVLCMSLTVAPLSAFAAESLSNFRAVNEYTEGMFSDVSSTAWYADSVKAAYEYDLVKGSGNGFNPLGTMTIAEAVTLASRLHSIYYVGEAKFVQGQPWYQVYVDYAVSNGIIKAGEYADYSKDITRAQFAKIFASALPEKALKAINNIYGDNIPDVPKTPSTADYRNQVALLYRAGVLTGSDEYGTFKPNSEISRSEVATIVTRMANESLRKSFALAGVVRPKSISLSDMTLKTGEFKELQITCFPEDAYVGDVEWSSENPLVAVVSDDGSSVFAASAGKTTLTAKCGNLKATCEVTVSFTGTYTLTPNPAELTLAAGESKDVSIAVNYTGDEINLASTTAYYSGYYIDVEWQESGNWNNQIIRVTGLKPGETQLDVTIPGSGAHAYIDIKITPPVAPKVSFTTETSLPVRLSQYEGAEWRMAATVEKLVGAVSSNGTSGVSCTFEVRYRDKVMGEAHSGKSVYFGIAYVYDDSGNIVAGAKLHSGLPAGDDASVTFPLQKIDNGVWGDTFYAVDGESYTIRLVDYLA